MLDFFNLFILFIIYSFVGYLIEIAWFTYEEKKFVNRGFLFGPICPIYGLGAVLLTWLLTDYKDDPVKVFIYGLLLTSFLEYYTSYLMEKIFHNRWWDYSNRLDNINGRICVLNSIAFGIGALLIICYSNEFFLDLFAKLPDVLIISVGAFLLMLFVIDNIYSFIIAYEFRNQIIIVEELKKQQTTLIYKHLENSIRTKFNKFKTAPSRFIKAFPNLINVEEIAFIKDISTKMKKEKIEIKNKNK